MSDDERSTRRADADSADSEDRRGFRGQIVAKAPEEHTRPREVAGLRASRVFRRRARNINRNIKRWLRGR